MKDEAIVAAVVGALIGAFVCTAYALWDTEPCYGHPLGARPERCRYY